MKITSFGRDEHRIMSAAMVKALQVIGDEFEVDFTVNGGTLGERKGMIKVEVSLRADETHPAGAAAEFARFAPMFGADPAWFGKKFMFKNAVYQVTGIQPSAPKFAIKATRTYDDKLFRFPVSTIKSLIGV